MTATPGYALLDAGDGRRLERFGDRVVDRPAPGATDAAHDAEPWARADLRFDRRTGWHGANLDPWAIEVEDLTLELRPTEAGQVGLFPEHQSTWPWLRDHATDNPDGEVLNLFASTGATTLALARAGVPVVHVDSSKPAVAWARRNAELSALADARVRWIVDDAVAFTRREVRRESRYRGIVLDPPAYGHGPGRAWRLPDDIDGLLRTATRLLARPGFILVTTHTTGWDAERLAETLDDAIRGPRPESGDLHLRAESGATLNLGAFARVMID